MTTFNCGDTVRLRKSFLWVIYSGLTSLPFLVWRLFFFESKRGATDVGVKLGDVLSNPLVFALQWLLGLFKDMIDVVFFAWIIPLQRLGAGITTSHWFLGVVITGLVLVLVWQALKGGEISRDIRISFDWRTEAIWLGGCMLVFGLLPVILVGRSVDFKSFSRYALVPSIGGMLLWQAGLSYIRNTRFRDFLLVFLIGISSLTHYANGLVKAREAEATRNFWWQVSWRIPALETGTTIITRYSVVAEEDYFTWGPANLKNHPESANERYVQPSIYAAILNRETIEKVLAREPQEFSNRRSIRTYTNYRNILILTQPTPTSCVQVIDQNQVELSSHEDPRIVEIAPYSEVERIFLDDDFRTPPFIPFGAEPAYEWCYYYQKAGLARQRGDWDEIIKLGREATQLGFAPKDLIEWMPFLQAYAITGNTEHLVELAPVIQSDPYIARQVCQIIDSRNDLDNPVREVIDSSYCVP